MEYTSRFAASRLNDKTNISKRLEFTKHLTNYFYLGKCLFFRIFIHIFALKKNYEKV